MYKIENNIPIPNPFCKCGCRNEINGIGEYISGHNRKNKKHSIESRKKMSKVQKGRKSSDETKRKISESGKGRIVSDETKRKITKANTGSKRSDETKIKMSKSQKGRIISIEHRNKISKTLIGTKASDKTKRKLSESRTGNKHFNWKGGISFEPYSIEFNKQLKSKIKQRDNHQCQNPNCKGTYKRLSIHHINYDKNNCSEENLITICNSCNSKANFNREYWTALYQSQIEIRKVG